MTRRSEQHLPLFKRGVVKSILLCPCTDNRLMLCILQKGTYVENLTEVILRDSDHLKELISVCEGGYYL